MINFHISNTKGYQESLKDSPQWAEAYGITEFLMKKFNVKIAAEIGVARAHHSAHLLEAIPDLKLYSIDPWGLFIKEHKPMYPYHSFEDEEKIYQKAVHLLKSFGQRSKIIRSTSKRAVDLISEPLDMIFIDADHSYEAVKEDIGLWWDKVKVGGIISGHDYGHSDHPGVKRAVDEYFGNKGLEINKEVGTVWWVQKPKELLSYIVTTYNSINFLREAIESIFRQNLKIPFEVIISDDASTDGTQNLIIQLAEKYPEIRYFFNKKNQGGSKNRNFAIQQSKGNFIYMFDHDNILEDNTIQKLIDAINKRGCGAASVGECYFFKGDISDHRGSWVYKYLDNLFTLQEFINFPNSPAASNNYMYTRAVYNKVGGYPENLGARGDNLGFGFRLVANGFHIAIVPGTKYYHRIVPNSFWLKEQNRNPEKAHKSMALIFREFIEVFDEKSQKLILSEKAEKEADNYISKKLLRLSEKGLDLCGIDRKNRLKFGKLNLRINFYLNKIIARIFKKLKLAIKKILKKIINEEMIVFYHFFFKNKFAFIKQIFLLRNFFNDFKKYQLLETNQNFILKKKDIKPCIFDKTAHPIDYVYFYQDNWCARKIFENKPNHHYDIGSKLELVGIIAQFVPTTFIDFRQLDLRLNNLSFINADILSLPFKDNSIQSLSSICVIEHVGLGRYGDKLDSFGSEKAINELKRVLAKNGNLYISVPVDKENIVYFNAHRAFTRDYILKLFAPLKLIEEKYLYKKDLIDNYDATRGFGTGMFHFKK